jgi:hypothetical protein
MTPAPTAAASDSRQDIAERLMAEGTRPLVDAARDARLQPVPSLRTLLRAAISGRLESLKVAGRRVTSPAAVVRWVAAQQRRAEPPPMRADPGEVLGRYGLAREAEGQ